MNPAEIISNTLTGIVEQADELDQLGPERIALAIIAALEVAGYKVLAREATEEMRRARPEVYCADIYRGMWDAAPRYDEPR